MDIKTQALYQRIQTYSLDAEGSSFSFSQRVIDEYKKFVLLAMVAGHVVSPSDQDWHLHLTYTRSYWDEFCKDIIGSPLHHEPTRGRCSEQQKFRQLYQQTLAGYERLFKQTPPIL
ncbi:MAG: hypothetical protein PHC94_11965 [Methylobacter sp.]|nr:hypothetical protein [Methylobacter sp.]